MKAVRYRIHKMLGKGSVFKAFALFCLDLSCESSALVFLDEEAIEGLTPHDGLNLASGGCENESGRGRLLKSPTESLQSRLRFDGTGESQALPQCATHLSGPRPVIQCQLWRCPKSRRTMLSTQLWNNLKPQSTSRLK